MMVWVILLGFTGVFAIWYFGYLCACSDATGSVIFGMVGLLFIALSAVVLVAVTTETYETSLICRECGEVYDSEYEYCQVDGTKLEE